MMSANSGDGFLVLEHITKEIGDVKILKGISLSVAKGEFISLLGPSGCGKTTLLRIIAGFVSSEGNVLLEDILLNSIPAHRRNTAMVFQNYALFPHMTVRENIAFGLRMHGVARSEMEQRIGRAVALVRLDGLEGRYPRQLSGGQQQRLALARAVVLNPKVLLLDEPLSNLDAKLRKDLRQELLSIHRAAGTTSIFVTHDVEEAFTLSDRVVIMNKGNLEQVGSPTELFRNPRTPFVADFLGHTNLLEGVVSSGGGSPSFQIGDLQVRVSDATREGQRVKYAIPQHLLRISPQLLQSENAFKGKVAAISCLGSLMHVQIKLSDQVTMNAEVPAHHDLLSVQKGDTVSIGWDRSDMIGIPVDA